MGIDFCMDDVALSRAILEQEEEELFDFHQWKHNRSILIHIVPGINVLLLAMLPDFPQYYHLIIRFEILLSLEDAFLQVLATMLSWGSSSASRSRNHNSQSVMSGVYHDLQSCHEFHCMSLRRYKLFFLEKEDRSNIWVISVVTVRGRTTWSSSPEIETAGAHVRRI